MGFAIDVHLKVDVASWSRAALESHAAARSSSPTPPPASYPKPPRPLGLLAAGVTQLPPSVPKPPSPVGFPWPVWPWIDHPGAQYEPPSPPNAVGFTPPAAPAALGATPLPPPMPVDAVAATRDPLLVADANPAAFWSDSVDAIEQWHVDNDGASFRGTVYWMDPAAFRSDSDIDEESDDAEFEPSLAAGPPLPTVPVAALASPAPGTVVFKTRTGVKLHLDLGCCGATEEVLIHGPIAPGTTCLKCIARRLREYLK